MGSAIQKGLLQASPYFKALGAPTCIWVPVTQCPEGQGGGFPPAAGGGPDAGCPLPPAWSSTLHPRSSARHLQRCFPPAALPSSWERPDRHLPRPLPVWLAGHSCVLPGPSYSGDGSVVCNGTYPTLDCEARSASVSSTVSEAPGSTCRPNILVMTPEAPLS